jgi:very-short-patch-repair endonuclease
VTGEGMKKIFARKLRKDGTDAEANLWYRLRNRQMGYKFRRQEPIGRYIIDFVCIEKMLIIELDGSQHLEQKLYDEERTKFLERIGYKVIRFWNNEVLTSLDDVLECVMNHLKDLGPPHPPRFARRPLPGGEVKLE